MSFILNMFDYISCVSPSLLHLHVCAYTGTGTNTCYYYSANNYSIIIVNINYGSLYGTCLAAKSKQTLFLLVIKVIFLNNSVKKNECCQKQFIF